MTGQTWVDDGGRFRQLLAEFVVIGIMVTMGPSHLMLAAFAIGAINVLFYHLLERPTLRGRGVLDRLDGFKAYLAGSDSSGVMPKTADRLAVFERFLPYAIATGREGPWTEAFAADLKPAMSSRSSGSRPLSWYDHSSPSFSAANLSSALGSGLASTLSSASSPPSSSGGGGGGFSGGGSSGGGGGGGGGGGW